MSIHEEARELGQTLWKYQEQKVLMRQLFEQPDSITYIPEDMDEFTKRTVSAEQKVFFEQDDRFVTLMRASGRIGVGSWGSVQWIEVIAPRAEEIQLGYTGVQRLNFIFHNVNDVRPLLDIRGVPFVHEEGTMRDNVSVLYHEKGYQFGFVDIPSQDVLDQHRAA